MSLDYRTFQSAGKISSHIIPGAYSRIDSIRGAAGLASANNGVIMGRSVGGMPTTLLQFNTVAEAVNALQGGELMDAVRLAFDPGAGVSPQRIFAMRVNSATQATRNLVKGANPMITLKSRDYGVYTNQIKVLLEAGTTNGKKMTVSFKSDSPEVFDNIYRPSFTILYGAACTMTIVNNSGTKTLVTSAGGINIVLSNYSTIGDMCAYINTQALFTCAPVAGQEGASPSELDAVTAQSIAAQYTAQSTFQAIIDTVNANSARLSAVAANAAINREIPDNLAVSYLAGATDGTYTASEWTAALTALEAEDIQFISTPSSDSAVHASIKTHCNAMSSVTGRKERQFVLGAPVKSAILATEMSTAIAAAVTLNSQHGMYVFNGGTQRDVDGNIQNYGASYAACMLMAMKTALGINQPLTFKELNFIALEWKLSDSQLENLLKNGVAAINYSPNGVPRLVRQFNTYQTNDLKFNEFSVVTEMYFASRDLRVYLENSFTGQPGTAIVGGVLRGAVESRLTMYEELGIFIKHPTEKRSWWNVQISIVGDAVYIDYDAYVTLPVNFQFITSHFHEMVATA